MYIVHTYTRVHAAAATQRRVVSVDSAVGNLAKTSKCVDVDAQIFFF